MIIASAVIYSERDDKLELRYDSSVTRPANTQYVILFVNGSAYPVALHELDRAVQAMKAAAGR